MSSHDRTVVVTGAGSGIGRATALLFGQSANVVCADIARGEETAGAIRAAGGSALAVTLDVRRPADWTRLVEETGAAFGRIGVLASVAGVVAPATDTAVDQDEEGWQRIIDVDLKGVWLGMRAIIPGMIEAGGGRIINVASMAGLIGLANLAAYSAAKGGVVSLSRQTAIQYAAQKVLVNVIAPGIIDTPILHGIPDSMRSLLCTSTPLGRMGAPEDIANMILALAGPAGNFVTGQVLAVDGGWTAQ